MMVLASEPASDTHASIRREQPRIDAVRSAMPSVRIARWLPAGFAAVVTIGWLLFYDVPILTTARFVGYLALGITLPGMLLWRFTHRGSAYLVGDLAAGAAVGYAIQVLTYIPGRAIGLPYLPVAIEVITLVAFVAVPGLRRYWRGNPDKTVPMWWSWALVGIWLFLLLWSVRYVSVHGLSWPSYAAPDADMPFHLALIGEAKHHMPLMTPWVRDEPVLYHWFVYAEMASTSWATGIEPQFLLARLAPLPFLAGFVALIPLLTRRLTGNWWSGIAAVAASFFMIAPHPYGWKLDRAWVLFGFSPVEDGSMFRLMLWTSPTQTFATLLFVPAVLVAFDLLHGRGRDIRRWVAFAVLVAAVMGAKATFLPLFLGGFALVVAVHLVVARRWHRPALVAFGITLVCTLFAQFVLFGTDSQAQGMGIGPLASIRDGAASAGSGLSGLPLTHHKLFLALSVTTFFSWVCIWGGAVGLRRRLREPRVVLLFGIGLAGIAAVLVFNQSGGSQGYFLQSARPYLAVLAACGLSAMVPRMTWRAVRLLLASAVVGVALVRLVRFLDGPTVPKLSQMHREKLVLFQLIWPYALLFGLLVLAAVGLWLARRRIDGWLAVAMVVTLAAGFCLYGVSMRLSMVIREGRNDGWRNVVSAQPTITRGTLEAARWLRNHSSANDLVATNAHCVYINRDDLCDGLNFAIAAYSERRMLVEGWAFTPTSHIVAAKDPKKSWTYWKPDVLRDNDAVFRDPTARSVAKLREDYGVDWLFVDEKISRPPAALADFAELRYRSGSCVVYEVKR